MAAIAALTEVAVAEARDETEQTLRGSFLEELLTRPDLDPAEVARARRGWAATWPAASWRSARTRTGAARAAWWRRSPPSCRARSPRRWRTRSTRCCPDRRTPRAAPRRLGRHAQIGLSSYRSGAAEARRALEEAELVLGVTAAGGGPPGAEIGEGTYRLLFRVLASHPQEVRSFFEDTVAPLVRYDEQYATDLVGTVEAYLDQQLQHERDRPGDPRAPPHGGVPAGAGARAERPRSAASRRTASAWAWG